MTLRRLTDASVNGQGIVLELADHSVAEQIDRVIAILGDAARQLAGRVTIIRIDGVRQRTL